jgi:hypothetical protein
MQQRQLRLGDILDDYCPRERRVTNHAVVAMIGAEVKQTRCTTCDAEHEFKHAKVPRQRRKAATSPTLYSQVLAGGPKRVAHEPLPDPQTTELSASEGDSGDPQEFPDQELVALENEPTEESQPPNDEAIEIDEAEHDAEQGPAHRRLIRATLPRPEGQPPPTRPAPEFTIRQPNTRPGRFRPRQQRGPSPFHTGQNGNRSGNIGGGMPRSGGGRPPRKWRYPKPQGAGGGGRQTKKCMPIK